jgi:large subunit ribosomal protein L19
LIKRKNLFKRSAYIMQTLEYEAAAAAAASRPAIPAFRAGDVLDIQFAVPDNKERLTTFRGLVIARYNRGISSSVTLRAVIHDNAVERTFPLYSPHIKSITLVERRHAARAKLFFLRRKPLRDSRIAGGGIVSAGAAGAAAGTKQNSGGGGGAAQKEAAKGPAASRAKK